MMAGMFLCEEMEIHNIPVQFISEILSLLYKLRFQNAHIFSRFIHIPGFLDLIYLNMFKQRTVPFLTSTCPLVHFTKPLFPVLFASSY
jgi:hypothetical protein